MEEVPRRTSLAPFVFPCFVLHFIGVETEGFFDYQGRVGIISIVRWNLRPVIFGVDLGDKIKGPSWGRQKRRLRWPGSGESIRRVARMA